MEALTSIFIELRCIMFINSILCKYESNSFCLVPVVTALVTTDGVIIGNRIYWTLK
jgi:hypothetical protein